MIVNAISDGYGRKDFKKAVRKALIKTTHGSREETQARINAALEFIDEHWEPVKHAVETGQA